MVTRSEVTAEVFGSQVYVEWALNHDIADMIVKMTFRDHIALKLRASQYSLHGS